MPPARTLPLFVEPPPVRGPRSPLPPVRAPRHGPPLIVHPKPRAVRLSITDRCDLACIYCRPDRRDGYLPARQRLAADRWAVLVRALVAKGVGRIRITGGEPLVHPEVVEIVRSIAAVPGVVDLALTTNGTRLAELARPLRDVGLERVNVSVDSLRPGRFQTMTQGGELARVIAGIHAARAAGFSEVKTNTVVVGPTTSWVHNDDELPSLVQWAWSVGATPRFLELMKIGQGAKSMGAFVPYAIMRERLADMVDFENTPIRPDDRGPARYLRARDCSGRHVGFITGTSDTFCEGCDRLRATSDGKLRPCLATEDAVDVSGALARGDVAAIGEALDEAWAMKPDGVVWKGCTEDSASDVSMRATGG